MIMEEKNNVRVNNTPSIEYTLRPISYTSWFLGAGVARPRNYSKTTTIINRIIYLIVCTVYMVLVTKEVYTFFSVFALKSDIFEFLYFMNIVTFHVPAYYNVYHGIRQYKKWPELMDRMKELDQKIRLQTTINDRPVKNLQALAILTTFAWCPLVIIAHVFYYYFTNPENIYVSEILYYYMAAQALISSFVFDVVVYVIYHRFKTISKLIRQLNERNELNELLHNPRWIALKIRRIRELYTGICQLVSMVNDIYGLYLLLCSVKYFVTVVIGLFTIYTGDVEEKYSNILTINIDWILHVAQFGLMCWICTLTRQESNKIGRSVYEIVFNCKYVNFDKIYGAWNQSSFEMRLPFEKSDSKQNSRGDHNYVVLENLSRRNSDRDYVRKEINDFSIQLQLYRVAFTACDFFEINNTLFSGFVGTIITYLIIFIQFYQPHENKNVVERVLKNN